MSGLEKGATAFLAGLIVIALAGDRVCALTRFEAGALPRFGLPRSFPS